MADDQTTSVAPEEVGVERRHDAARGPPPRGDRRGRHRVRRRGREDGGRGRAEVPRTSSSPGTLRIAQWSHFVPGVRHVVRQHLRQAAGASANDTEVTRRPHQPGRHPGARGRRGRRPERPRPRSGSSRRRRSTRTRSSTTHDIVAGGDEEAREDGATSLPKHVQPEDEEVLRLRRQLRAGPGQLAASTSGARSGIRPTTWDNVLTGGTAAPRDAAIRSGSGCRTRSTRTWP